LKDGRVPPLLIWFLQENSNLKIQGFYFNLILANILDEVGQVVRVGVVVSTLSGSATVLNEDLKLTCDLISKLI
jgi:hypothetical protein